MFYLNMCSLFKNLLLLEDFIIMVEEVFEIIVIFEMKLKENNIYNISILGYLFININFRIVVGGVVIYIVNELDFF